MTTEADTCRKFVVPKLQAAGFLQLIRRKLRKSSAGSQPVASSQETGKMPVLRYARAVVVVANGTLFGDGVCARIKEELLKEFNLYTIVRLPNGVFAPYTSIPTNILFSDRSGPTRDVWYYEQPLPKGRKNYTKTAPIQFEEFAPLIEWWDQPGPGAKRKENERAWKVPGAELLASGCNLDRKNPRAKEDITHLPPAQLAASILNKEQRIAEIMGNIQKLLAKNSA
jgi:type I restriction enzyme M protein